jgi:hypothetical protein
MAIPNGETPCRKDWCAQRNLAPAPAFGLTGKFTPRYCWLPERAAVSLEL